MAERIFPISYILRFYWDSLYRDILAAISGIKLWYLRGVMAVVLKFYRRLCFMLWGESGLRLLGGVLSI